MAKGRLKILAFSILLLGLWPGFSSGADLAEPLLGLPVQDSGRVKPYDSFAREALELIYGKTSYRDKQGQKRSAAEVVTTWMLIPDHWEDVAFMEVRLAALREALKLEGERRHFQPKELRFNERLPLILQELRSKRESGEKLNPYFQEVQRLENLLNLYEAIRLGMAVRVVPQKESDTWLSVGELTGPLKDQFQAVTAAFVKVIATSAEPDKKGDLQARTSELEQQVKQFMALAAEQAPDKYPSSQVIQAEVHYNAFHPFMWSWVMYLIGGAFLIGFMVSHRPWLDKAGWLFLVIGVLLQTYGMALRSYLSGRPPVSNMYETVVWVAYGTVLFAMLIAKLQKSRLILVAASVIAILCLVLTDLAPSVLDDSLHPLEPVLRSTFWLTTHVLVITISYAAFFLAFGIGDVLLYYFLKDEQKYAKQIQQGVQSIYRSMQIGVVLLAAGIILGGIWADYSWGRFWGWDPKETWALIALLGYLAILHGRLVGWIRNFGMAAGSVLAFSLVIMAWYGVNYVLGAGLHSYGFGAGGVEWVSGFVAIHILYVAFVYTVRRSRQKAPGTQT